MITFDTLLGNESVKHDLKTALLHRFPQTILLTGATEAERADAAKIIAAGLFCKHDTMRPCGACSACKKVEADVYPDLTIIDDGENELKVDLARKIKADSILVPTEGARRVTIVHHAQKLNTSAQNALLKEIEEPPKYAFFILTSAQPEQLLQTVRSRCTVFQLDTAAQPEAPDDALLALVSEYLIAVAEQREDKMMLAAVGMEKLSRPQMQTVCTMLKCAFRDAVFAASGLTQPPLLPALEKQTQALAIKITPRKLIRASDFMNTLTERLSRNASAAAMTCALTADCYTIYFL